jgi:hypothetical protein
VCVAVLSGAGPPSSQASRALTGTQLHRTLTGTDLSVQFSRTPAREVFQHLKTVLGVPIVGRYSDDKVGYGIDPETPITLDVSDTPAIIVLERVLDQCEDIDPCTWQVRNGFVEVGTKQRLSVPAAQVIKLYPIRDLMMIAPHFDNAPGLDLAVALNQTSGSSGSSGGSGGGFGGGSSGSGGGGGAIISAPSEGPVRVADFEFVQDLMELIQGAVEPWSWADNGGEARMSYLSGNLIIRAPGFIHRQLGRP